MGAHGKWHMCMHGSRTNPIVCLEVHGRLNQVSVDWFATKRSKVHEHTAVLVELVAEDVNERRVLIEEVLVVPVIWINGDVKGAHEIVARCMATRGAFTPDLARVKPCHPSAYTSRRAMFSKRNDHRDRVTIVHLCNASLLEHTAVKREVGDIFA